MIVPPKLNFGVEYFKVASAEDEQLLCAQVETVLTKTQYEEVTGDIDGTQAAIKSNKGKHLMLFNDQSGSMSGTPFETLKKACLDLGEVIFSADGDKSRNVFEKVHTIFYNHVAHPTMTDDKAAYLQHIQSNYVTGGTDFCPCFDVLAKTVKEHAQEGSEFVVMFFTDGQGNSDDQRLQQLNKLFKEQQQSKNVTVTIYSIGFSAYHDAELLNKLA